MKTQPKIIAHRGYSLAFQENTIESFLGAINSGADAIETDLHITKDKVIVLKHDYTLLNGKLLKEVSYEELIKIEPYIPRLEELIEIVKGKDIELLLEIKERDVIPVLIPFLRKINFSNIIIGSFDWITLQEIKHYPDSQKYPTSLMLGSVMEWEDIVSLAQKYECSFVHPCWEARSSRPHELLDAKIIEQLSTELGISTILWHEERPEFLKPLLQLPVYGVCTNDPPLALKLRTECPTI
ncbi:MAG: glycerophosphodiester phosphodiesterase [Candidatus Nanohaloarchaeota archaeon]|nr:glycerophosphodiester phosphodiesterase [Candidatus Nanohaloarchaeota archaeon]